MLRPETKRKGGKKRAQSPAINQSDRQRLQKAGRTHNPHHTGASSQRLTPAKPGINSTNRSLWVMIETVPTRALTHSLTHCGFNSLPPGCSFPRITSEHVRLQFHRLPLRPDQQPRFLLPSISYRETSLLKHRNGKPQEST